MLRRFLIFGLFVGLMFGLGCGKAEKESDADVSEENANSTPVDSIILTLTGVEGKSVFEITQKEHDVEYIESAVGMFVHAIDSIEIGSVYGWMYSVNDSMGQVASDKYITSDSDLIKWHFRRFK